MKQVWQVERNGFKEMVMMLLLKLWIKWSRKLSLPMWEAVFCGKQAFLVFPPPPFRIILISESTWKGPCCEASLLWSLGFGSDLPWGSLQEMAAGCDLTAAWVIRVWAARAFMKMALLGVTATGIFVLLFQAASFQCGCLFGLHSEVYCRLLISKWRLEGWVEHYPPCLISHIWIRNPEISFNI